MKTNDFLDYRHHRMTKPSMPLMERGLADSKGLSCE
jgi:hypothetical protein